MIAIAYAWSQSSVSFFLSTVGDTSPADTCYESKYEDEYGDVQSKKILRPDICDFIFQFLPAIDNHNKLRQHHLALEKSWPTKKCWFRLHTTFIGMSVVDLYRLYYYHDSVWRDITLLQFADMLCGSGLMRRQRKILPVPLRQEVNDNNLERITDASGNTCKRVTSQS